MNPQKGDVPLEVAGKTYTLRFNFNAIVMVENKLNKGIAKLMGEMANVQEMRIGNLAALLWAGLQKHHRGMSLEDATDLLDDVEGGMPKIIDILGDCLQRSFNAPGTKGTNPPAAAGNGTGTPSSSTTSVQDMIPTPSGN